MSFSIRNKTTGPAVPVPIDDLGITVPAGADYDLRALSPLKVAISSDLQASISAGDIVVIDPFDGTTELSIADSSAVVSAANDPHWRLGQGARIGDHTDVDLTGITNGQVLIYNAGGSNFVAGSVFTPVDRVQAYYVNKHGNDANDGLIPDEAFLTFGAAITAASAQTPSTTNRFAIICDDAGVYTENITIPSWVTIEAQTAKIAGTVTLSDNSELTISEVEAVIDNPAVQKTAGTSSARVNADTLISTGSGNTISHTSATVSVLIVKARQVYVENGAGVLDDSADPSGHVHIDLEDIYITGTGTGIDRQSNNGFIVGRVSHILDIGVGSGTAIDIGAGRVDVAVGFIDTDTAYSVSGTGTLRMFVNEANGTRTQASGTASVDVLEANVLRWITITSADSPYTPRRVGYVGVDTTAGAITISLPSPPSDGDNITFQDSRRTFATNNLTIDAGVGNLIEDGGAGIQTVVLSVDGTSGIMVYNAATSRWNLTRTQEEVAVSPSTMIYVSKNGDDTIGDGSFSNPFLTIKKGVTEALSRVAATPVPTTVNTLNGVYDEVNPIAISGTNSEYVQAQGQHQVGVVVRPTVDTSPLFTVTSPTVGQGPQINRMTLDASNLGTFKTNGQAAVVMTGPGRFVVERVDIKSCGVGIDSGNGVTTDQEAVYDFGTISDCTIGIDAKGDGVQAAQVCFLRNNATGISAGGNVTFEIGNFSLQGADVGDPPANTGIVVSDDATLGGTSGTVSNLTLGLEANDSSVTTLATTIFTNNTTDFNQVDATAQVLIQGFLSKTKQLIADGSLVALSYVDTDTADFVVGSADSTGDPGKEFRVRDFDGRVAIGDNATDANIASGGVGGSRSVNLIDENGNFRIWRFASVAGEDPAFEWIKGINPANPDGVGDAPISAITAATDTITIDVSGTDYNDPFDGTPGIDRTTLADRAFPAGRLFRVNGTASNDGDYTVVSATYNSGPQTIDIVVTTNITVTEGAVGTVVFGGGAGRTDGVSTYVGDPGAAVAAGAGNVWWDMFLQETDNYVIRRRTGGGGGLDDEKVRIFSDRSEWLGATAYDSSDNEFIAILQAVASAANYLTISNAAATAGPEVTATGSDTNIDIELVPKGTGTVTVPTGYEANITADEDLVNKAYVDGISGPITLSTIGGNLIPTFVDTGRSSKTLSVECPSYVWSEAAVTDSEWYAIGNATDGDTSYIMPFDGTVVGMTAHCENDNGQAKGIGLVINTGAPTAIGSFGGVGANSTISDSTLDIDFSAGDRIRLQSDAVGTDINDTVVTLRVRWRA